MKAIVLVFVLVLFTCVGPVAGQFVITGGGFNQTVSIDRAGGDPDIAFTQFGLSDGAGFTFSTTGNTNDQPQIVPVLSRGGTSAGYTWTYNATGTALGDVHWGGTSYEIFALAGTNPQAPQTKMTFVIGPHSIPKFTAAQLQANITVPFTMEGTVALFPDFSWPGNPLFTKTLSGSGTVKVMYHRRVPGIKTLRRLPNAQLFVIGLQFSFTP